MAKKPAWLKVPYNAKAVAEVEGLLAGKGLHSVCQEAACPNLGECFGKQTATFMVLGSVCSRNCRFCNVSPGRPQPPDPEEPQALAQAVQALGLKHVVITQVTRDDLPDGGAAHLAACIAAVGQVCPTVTVEVLISDLGGKEDALAQVLAAKPQVLNHNVEMVPRLYPSLRPQGNYQRSLEVLRRSKALAPEILTKTGFMVGLGETDAEIDALLEAILATGCDILTVSQYLQPSPDHAPLDRYVPPEDFDRLKDHALAMGFRFVAAKPLVRSSYQAAEALEACRQGKKLC